MFVTDGESFGTDELQLGDAEETEYGAQIGLLEVHGHSGAAAVVAAATGGDDQLLVASEAFGALRGVAEGFLPPPRGRSTP